MGAFIDLAVIVGYFALILWIGLAQKDEGESVLAFTLGNRGISWWAVLASILAAEISAAGFLGAPETGYLKMNWSYAQFSMGSILGRVIVSFLFIPVFYRLGVISVYEFLETRFGKKTRKLASATFLVTRMLALGTRLFVSAIILVLAVSMWRGGEITPDIQFWLFTGAITVITVLTALYTSIGGIQAVIWTDFIQVSVLVAALAFTIPYLVGQIPGGLSSVAGYIHEPVFLDFAKPEAPGILAWVRNVLTEEYTLWAALIGTAFVTLATHGIDQDTVQRMLTARNRKESAKAAILSGLVDFPITLALVGIGILLSVFYHSHSNVGLPVATREIFPYFILHEMPAGLRGLVIAAILATAMGSLGTAINAMGTSFSRDFIFPRLRKDATEYLRVLILKWSTVGFAGLTLCVGIITAWYMSKHPEAAIIPLVMGIMGFTFGSLLGVFLLGTLTRTRGNDFGNILGMVAGFAAVVGLSRGIIGGIEVSFPWRITFGSLITFGIAACFKTPVRTEP